MPKLDTTLHLDMYRAGKKKRTLPARIKQALKVLFAIGNVYGLEWGDPETNPPLAYVRDHFLLPYVTQETTALEIGPGGGRWTRYMLGVKRLYAVDFHQELLNELKSNFSPKNLTFVKNNGNDFPGMPNESIDFIFSFGTFVHLDVEIIDQYLRNMKTLLKPSSNVVIQYSDKSKPLGKSNKGFSQNDPDTMRRLVSSHGYFIYEEDIKTLWHSSVIRFGTREADA
jgi:ubiquinone/menaquinone biosynthesis C-methylase UbiE